MNNQKKAAAAATNAITEGIIWRQLLIFFFPIVLGTFFQQLYNTADAMIVGRFVGKEALAAVGGSSNQIINLIIGFFVGVSSGATVIIDQHYGSRKETELSHALHTAIAFSTVSSIFLMGAGYFLAPALLSMMNTPESMMADSVTYLRIFFLGILFTFIYNIGSSILRSVGDSKRPLYILVFSCLVNIVLDLVFVVVLRMSVQGVGIATILSQFISAVLITFCLMRTNECYRLQWSKVRFHKMLLIRIIQIGVPAGLQSVMYNIANIIIQSNVNLLGSNTMAAYTAYSKIDAVFWMIMNAFGVSVSTFAGQNFGAGKLDRVRKSMKICLGMALGASIGLSVILHFFGRYVYMLFTTDAQVIEIGMQILYFLTPIYFTYVTIEVISGTVRSMGFVFTPMLMTCGGVCVLRLLWLFIAVPQNRTITNILFSYPLSWVVTSVLFIIYYIYLNKTGKIEAAREHSLV